MRLCNATGSEHHRSSPHAASAARQEPTTPVVFELHAASEGVLLTVGDPGFDSLPPARRASAYRGNDSGWTEQMDNIARYVGAGA